MRMTKMSFGDAVRLIVAMMGDSYTRNVTTLCAESAQILWRYFNSAARRNCPPHWVRLAFVCFDPNGDNTDVMVHQLYSPDFPALTTQGMARIFSSVTASASGATISYSQNFALGFDSFLFAEGDLVLFSARQPGWLTPSRLTCRSSRRDADYPVALPTTVAAQ
ncbi:hypothetical protein [Klebsiella pneumoniae]|uniref:hypothetical protein n=1 Tax=Klebsiella pneumoniae TaxID=573 RepID=UPI00115A7948|nr:hypothetical protein [Klebsiella pneumoniae]